MSETGQDPKSHGAPAAPARLDAPGAAPAGRAPGGAAIPAGAPVPAQEPTPNPLAHLSIPFQAVCYSFRGFHLDATISPEQVVSAAEQLDREGFSLDTITGVDWIGQGQMEVIYDYFHPTRPLRAVVRTRVPRDNPEVPTICRVFPGANWHEREAHDFFGLRFQGHPDLTPFLLPEDADYHPLRKDFTA